MNINEKILQYIKKHKIGDDVKIKLTSDKQKTSGDEDTVETSVEKVSTKVNQVDDGKNQLLDKLKGLKSKLDGVKQVETLDMIEYTPLTEEEIAKKAGEGLEESYALKLNDLKNENQKKLNSLEKNKEVLTSNATEQKEKLQTLYKDAEEKVEQDAIKRGVSRSSIVSEQLKDLSIEKIKDELSIDYNLASELKANSDKISELENDYLVAVNKLNVEKALELSENIQKLTDKQNEKIEEVLKYNNSVKKQLATLKESEAVKITEKEKTKIKQDMLESALEYYLSLPREEALSRFENDDDVKEILGDLTDMLKRYIMVTQ